jgi:prefoldin subunit 5
MSNNIALGAAAAGKMTQVKAELNRLAATIESLEKTTECLESRIEEILRPCPTSVEIMEEAKPLVPLAASIRGMTMRVQKVEDFIRLALKRIEL